MMSDNVADANLNKAGYPLDWLILCGVACITFATPLYLYMTSSCTTESCYLRGFLGRRPSFAQRKKDDDMDLDKDPALPTSAVVIKQPNTYTSETMSISDRGMRHEETVGNVFFTDEASSFQSKADHIANPDPQESIDSHWEEITSPQDELKYSPVILSPIVYKPWYRKWF